MARNFNNWNICIPTIISRISLKYQNNYLYLSVVLTILHYSGISVWITLPCKFVFKPLNAKETLEQKHLKFRWQTENFSKQIRDENKVWSNSILKYCRKFNTPFALSQIKQWSYQMFNSYLQVVRPLCFSNSLVAFWFNLGLNNNFQERKPFAYICMWWFQKFNDIPVVIWLYSSHRNICFNLRKKYDDNINKICNLIWKSITKGFRAFML